MQPPSRALHPPLPASLAQSLPAALPPSPKHSLLRRCPCARSTPLSPQVGAYLAWFVSFLMLLTAPLTWPIGKLLDWTLGEESALFKRRELKALVSIHADQPVRRALVAAGRCRRGHCATVRLGRRLGRKQLQLRRRLWLTPWRSAGRLSQPGAAAVDAQAAA